MEVFVMMCMELESVIQSEVSQKEKNKYSMLSPDLLSATACYSLPMYLVPYTMS